MELKFIFNYRKIAYLTIGLILGFTTFLNAQWKLLGNNFTAPCKFSSMYLSKTGDLYAAQCNGQSLTIKTNNTTKYISLLPFGGYSTIFAITTDDSGYIYVTGVFKNQNGKYYVAKYNGTNWEELGGTNASTFNDSIYTINNESNGKFYTGGVYKNSIGRNYLGFYNDTIWNSITSPLSVFRSITNIIFDTANNVYVTGNFVNKAQKYYVAKFNGTVWSELVGTDSLASTSIINSITKDKAGNIYATTTGIGSAKSYTVSKFNGTSWSLVKGNTSFTFNNYINVIATDSVGNLYAAGKFTNSSGNHFVAKYDGTKWFELGGLNGLAANDEITKMVINAAGDVMVTGLFKDTVLNQRYIAVYNTNVLPIKFLSVKSTIKKKSVYNPELDDRKRRKLIKI